MYVRTRFFIRPLRRAVAAVARHLALDHVDTEARDDVERSLELGLLGDLCTLLRVRMG